MPLIQELVVDDSWFSPSEPFPLSWEFEDLVADYGAVFKPALLATREGGELICCNNVASVDAAEWIDALTHGMRRHGRTLRGVEIIRPEADFPSPDDRPPLKVR